MVCKYIGGEVLEKNESLVVEIDIDGTLADIYTPIENKIKESYNDFSFDNIKDYTMKNSGVGCPRVILYKWLNNPEIYKLTQPYKGAIELLQFFDKNKVKIVLNSKCENDKLAESKTEWIKLLLEKAGCTADIVLDDSIGSKKMHKEAYITIEDSLGNLKRSYADIKFIVDRHHNKEENNKEYSNLFYECTRVNNLSEIVEVLRDIYPEVFKNE